MARLLREEATSQDPRLDQLAEGTLDETSRASLEADAAADPALAVDVELHQPLPELVRARLRSIARAGLTQPETAADEPESVPSIASARAGTKRRRWASAAGLALAAGLAAVVVGPQLFAPPPRPLPTYAFVVQAGDATTRGPGEAFEKPDRRTVREDSEVSLVMRSSSGLEADDIRAVLFVLGSDGAHEVSLAPRRRNGAFLFRGQAALLTGGRRGALELVMRVEREGLTLAPPSDAAPHSGEGWFSQGVSLEVKARP